MLPERAGYRHQAVAEVARAPAVGDSVEGGGHGEAFDVRRQQHWRAGVVGVGEAVGSGSIGSRDVAVAQVGDAGAAHLAQPHERRAVAADAQRPIDPVAGAFDRRTVVRGAQEHQFLQPRRPVVAGFDAGVDGAARDQAAHAVAEDHQFLDFARPVGDQCFQHRREFPAAVGYVPAGVVMKVHARTRQRAGNPHRKAVAVIGMTVFGIRVPMAVVHAQPVRGDQQPGRRSGLPPGRRKRRGQAFGVDIDGRSGPVKGAADGQRVVGGRQVVAQYAVEHGQEMLARRRGAMLRLRRTRPEARKAQVQSAADQPGHAVNRAVDQAGNAAGARLGRDRPQARHAQDGVMQVLDQVGHAAYAVDAQPAEALKIGEMEGHAHGLPVWHVRRPCSVRKPSGRINRPGRPVLRRPVRRPCGRPRDRWRAGRNPRRSCAFRGCRTSGRSSSVRPGRRRPR